MHPFFISGSFLGSRIWFRSAGLRGLHSLSLLPSSWLLSALWGIFPCSASAQVVGHEHWPPCQTASPWQKSLFVFSPEGYDIVINGASAYDLPEDELCACWGPPVKDAAAWDRASRTGIHLSFENASISSDTST